MTGTLTPIFVGALIGTVTASTKIADVNMVLYIAMAVFALAFVVLLFIPISDPEGGSVTESTVFEASPWSFRHFVLGAIGIFLYVGIEVGIPGTLIFYLSDTTEKGGGILGNAASIAGTVAATYWFLMLVGRFTAGFIANLVSSKTMMVTTSCVGMILVIAAIVLGKSTTMLMPVFTGESFQMTTVPVAALLLVLCGLCTSVMWSSIFNLATEGLGKYTAAASGIFMMMVVGGGVLPLIQSFIADKSGYLISYIVPLAGLAYLFFYAIIGSKNINKDIPV